MMNQCTSFPISHSFIPKYSSFFLTCALLFPPLTQNAPPTRSSSPRPSLSTSSSLRRKFTPTKTQTQTQTQKGPRSPPQNMVIYLSTIVLPDLDPRRRSSSSTKNSYPYVNEGNGHGKVNGGGGKMEFGGEEVSTSTAAGTPAVGGSHTAGSSGSGGSGSAVKSFRGKLGKKLFRSSS